MTSPIIVDLSDSGYHLSNPEDGVWFHVFPDTAMDYQVAWPVAGSGNGWLVLDRNGNGLIDDFGELFGDVTDQPTPPPGTQQNGYLALAVFDGRDQGGNEDGWISKVDQVYDKLRVWVDENHDGISQPWELHTLESLDIAAISLKYTQSPKKDEYGNVFRYRGTLRDSSGGEARKVIYDVFLRMGAGRPDDSTASWFATPGTVGFTEDDQQNPASTPQ